MRDVIQSLWIGPELSVMERLSIASFLAHGHPFHLYTYDDVLGVPEGADVRDANEILPASMIFQYVGHPSYAGFANHFRYKLMLDRGGWWSDVDSVCLRPFTFETEYVFSSEMHEGEQYVNNGTIRAPAGSDAFAHAWRLCSETDPSQLRWGEMGPRLIARLIPQFGLNDCIQPAKTFCPIGYDDWELLLSPDPPLIPDDAYAIHLWNEMWRRAGRDKNAIYDPSYLYEQLKARYLSPGFARNPKA